MTERKKPTSTKDGGQRMKLICTCAVIMHMTAWCATTMGSFLELTCIGMIWHWIHEENLGVWLQNHNCGNVACVMMSVLTIYIKKCFAISEGI